MNKLYYLLMLLIVGAVACSDDDDPITPDPEPVVEMIDAHFDIESTSATHDADLEFIEMTISVKGQAGAKLPTPAGQLDGAPVLGYVFPTSLSPTDVGFGAVEGVVAMALTSHPDFDDTPLWDENNDKDYANDGAVWHPHWIVLTNDTRVKGGLSVLQFEPGDPDVILPPTNPGMPMYMDSPGYQVITTDTDITVVIPTVFVNGRTDFSYDAVTARMQVNTSDASLPMLGVYEVYEVLSGDLSLPYTIQ